MTNLRVGERVPLPKFSSYRTLYPIYENDVLLAFLGMETGWGKAWRVWRIQKSDHPSATKLGGFAPVSGDHLYIHASGFKAAAERAVERLADPKERHRFKTATELQELTKKMREAERRAACDRLGESIKAHALKLGQRNSLRWVLQESGLPMTMDKRRDLEAVLLLLDEQTNLCAHTVEKWRAKANEGVSNEQG